MLNKSLPIAVALFFGCISGARAQSGASIVFIPLADPSAYVSNSSSGWSSSGQNYSAVGLDLEWVNLQDVVSPLSEDWITYRITNTGHLASLDLSRYITFTLDPLANPGFSEYAISVLATYKEITLLSPGENFQIRSSYDNFAAPLITFDGVDGTTIGAVAPGTGGNSFFNFHQNSMTESLTTPLEFRFYYYGSSLDGMPAVDTYGAAVGAGPYTIVVNTNAVPETSAVLLFSTAGLLGVLRRRRGKWS